MVLHILAQIMWFFILGLLIAFLFDFWPVWKEYQDSYGYYKMNCTASIWKNLPKN